MSGIALPLKGQKNMIYGLHILLFPKKLSHPLQVYTKSLFHKVSQESAPMGRKITLDEVLT